MPRRSPPMPDNRLIAVVTLIVLVLILLWVLEPQRPVILPPQGPEPLPGPQAARPLEGYLFCTWNVENFFDDRDDPRNHDEDEDWFGRDPQAVRQKVGVLADALLRQNNGRGPDILAMVEVESQRAVELLRDALNDRLSDDSAYRTIVFRENRTGRRFAPAILTRLAARDGWTRGPRDFDNRRILEAHLEAEGAPLVVLASHWTSRVTDKTDVKRTAYAETVYRAFLDQTRANPAADVLLSGDFNDTPEDVAVRVHLRTVGDLETVLLGGTKPHLLNLMIGKDPEVVGTYFYRGRWQILDHILASPGLLDQTGWRILPETLRTENPPGLRAGRTRAPFRFGGPKTQNPRGPSDHFAVSVRLKVEKH
ncbi:MAG: endonuclease/exonuclease/phosphatase family protein [Isosphaeraceae bacterium]